MYAVLYPYELGCKLSSNIIETSAGVVEPVDVDYASRTNLSPATKPFSNIIWSSVLPISYF